MDTVLGTVNCPGGGGSAKSGEVAAVMVFERGGETKDNPDDKLPVMVLPGIVNSTGVKEPGTTESNASETLGLAVKGVAGPESCPTVAVPPS